MNEKHQPYFLIAVGNKEEEKSLRELSERVGGNELVDMDPIINQNWCKPFDHLYLRVSDDFKDCSIARLHGQLDYYGAPIKYMPGFIDWFENEYLPMKDVEIIKHIPHASLDLGPFDGLFWRLQDCIQRYNLKMSDVGVDILFERIKGIEVKAKYSRLYCDVERFKDYSKEPMSKLGQGYIYNKFYDGKDIFRYDKVDGVSVKDEIDKYYDEHHQKLNAAVKEVFDRNHKVLLLDIHSYSDELANALGKEGPHPDICIGINNNYYDKKILDLIIRKIKEKGYSYRINFPYEGSIIPTGILDGTLKGELCTIMLELNKRIYL